MERSEILAAMGGLKLFGMKAAYDEIVTMAVKRQHEHSGSSATCPPPRSARSRRAR